MTTIPKALAALATVSLLLNPFSDCWADEDADGQAWRFDKEMVGSLPAGWKVAETSSRSTPGTWQIVADSTAPSPAHAVAITQTENSGQTYNLLLADSTSYGDLEIEVMVRAISGKQDQGGGPMWRVQDADNYYIARWNPLEDNFRVYTVKAGKRSMLKSATVKVDPVAWHRIEIEHVGNTIAVRFDGEAFLVVEDSTFSAAGMVGLWTKADAATAFDDFEVIVGARDGGGGTSP
jgi:hypothetical protein